MRHNVAVDDSLNKSLSYSNTENFIDAFSDCTAKSLRCFGLSLQKMTINFILSPLCGFSAISVIAHARYTMQKCVTYYVVKKSQQFRFIPFRQK
jgi:hypothetical protein